MPKIFYQFVSIIDSNYQFNLWNRLKRNLEIAEPDQGLYVKEGQVWWCNLGKNLGVEINGKNETFNRPVLVLKRLGRLSFLAVPLTSQRKTGTWYVDFEFKSKHEYANLAQIRVLSVKRVQNRVGQVSGKVMRKVKRGLYNLYIK